VGSVQQGKRVELILLAPLCLEEQEPRGSCNYSKTTSLWGSVLNSAPTAKRKGRVKWGSVLNSTPTEEEELSGRALYSATTRHIIYSCFH
jgi:hypothetical protein